MTHIKTIKLFNGEKRYAVVAPFESVTKDGNGNMVKKVENLAVEYQIGKGVDAKIVPAIFSHDTEGLDKAKEIQKLFKKSSKK